MAENKEKSNYWQPAMEIFTRVSVWIAAPIIVALIAGKKLDAHFGTRPLWFLVLAAFGFLVSCLGIVRVIKRYTQKLKDLDK